MGAGTFDRGVRSLQCRRIAFATVLEQPNIHRTEKKSNRNKKDHIQTLILHTKQRANKLRKTKPNKQNFQSGIYISHTHTYIIP